MMMMLHHNENISTFSILLIFVFSVLLTISIVRKIKNKFKKPELGEEMPNKIFLIEGMICNHCAANVKDSLIKIKGVQEVRINLEKKNAVVDGDYNSEEVKEAITKAGYKVVK